MRSVLTLLAVAFFGIGPDAGASADEIFTIDFEQGADVSRYQGLELPSVRAEIVEGAPGGNGHCLRLQNLQPATSCALRLIGPIEVQKNLILSFDYRLEIEEGYEGAYLGMSWFVQREQWFWISDEFSAEWRHAQVRIPTLKSSNGKEMRSGLVFSSVQIYGRVKETTEVRTATKARMTVWFDNIRLYTGQPRRTLAERTRQSDSNPPLFHWPKSEGEGNQRLQYSRNQEFPEDASVTVEVNYNFHTPREPMEPGTWYWRVWSESELSEGWSDVEQVTISLEAHRFTTASVSAEQLTTVPRPRLLPYARLSEPNVTEKRKAQLVQSAKKLYDQGVEPHPGPRVSAH